MRNKDRIYKHTILFYFSLLIKPPANNHPQSYTDDAGGLFTLSRTGNFDSPTAVYSLVLSQSIYNRPHVNSYTVAIAACDLASYLNDTIVPQIARNFTLTVAQSPRITSVTNATLTRTTVNYDDQFDHIVFGGVGLSDQDLIKLAVGTTSCSSSGDANLLNGTTLVQGGPAVHLLHPLNLATTSTTMYVDMRFTGAGNGSICFRYHGSNIPAETGGWRRIGVWSVTETTRLTVNFTIFGKCFFFFFFFWSSLSFVPPPAPFLLSNSSIQLVIYPSIHPSIHSFIYSSIL